MGELGVTLEQLAREPTLHAAVLIADPVLGSVIAHRVVFAVLGRAARRSESGMANVLVRHCRRPTFLMFPAGAMLIVWPAVPLSADAAAVLHRGPALVFLASTGWAAVALINVVADFVVRRHRMDHADNLDARRVQTQAHVLRRIGVFLTVLITAGAMLMSIPSIRSIGISLFASAGIAGLALGLAARATLSNLLAGIQVALTQPIRLEDVVIVEGEWGWIEEIGLTYVVVRVWDLRRLVVPISYFIEQPYQNWTRTTADILGSVFIHVDCSIAFEDLRSALREILEKSGMWDGKVCVMHVTEAKEYSVEVRALMSAPSSPEAWELRCHVREKLIEWVREHGSEGLPRMRARMEVSSAARENEKPNGTASPAPSRAGFAKARQSREPRESHPDDARSAARRGALGESGRESRSSSSPDVSRSQICPICAQIPEILEEKRCGTPSFGNPLRSSQDHQAAKRDPVATRHPRGAGDGPARACRSDGKAPPTPCDRRPGAPLLPGAGRGDGRDRHCRREDERFRCALLSADLEDLCRRHRKAGRG